MAKLALSKQISMNIFSNLIKAISFILIHQISQVKFNELPLTVVILKKKTRDKKKNKIE